MKKAKGVVMRISGNKTVIYTNEGDFLEIPTPKKKPLVGQAIEVDLAPRRTFSKSSLLKYAVTAAALVLVLALGLFNPLFGPRVAVAAVELDINQGVELLVNKEGKIVKVHDTGQDSNKFIEGLELKGLDIYEAVQLILKNGGTKGVLGKEQNLVMVSVVPMDGRGAKVVDPKKLRGVVREEMLNQNIYGVVMVGQVNEETKRKAKSLGMTVNNYLVYERCRQDGLDIKADVFRGGDVQAALAKADVPLPKLFPEEYFEVKEQDHSSRTGESSGPGYEHQKPEYERQKPEHQQREPISTGAGTKEYSHDGSGDTQAGPEKSQEHSSGGDSHAYRPSADGSSSIVQSAGEKSPEPGDGNKSGEQLKTHGEDTSEPVHSLQQPAGFTSTEKIEGSLEQESTAGHTSE